MLDVAIVNRIREAVQANLDPRSMELKRALLRVSGSLASKGTQQSSMAVQQYIGEGKSDFTGRAVFIFQTITRTYSSMSGRFVDTLRQDLVNELAHLLTVHAGQVTTVIQQQLRGYISKFQDLVPKALGALRIEKQRQLESELEFYLDSLQRNAGRRELSSTSVSIVGDVGVLQTGAGAVTNIVIEREDQDRLARALDELRAAIERQLDAPSDARTDALTLVDDAKAAVTAARPSGPRIFGLLSGLGQAVQTLGAASPAWEVVKASAAAIGLLLA